jgi:hypothetical protein
MVNRERCLGTPNPLRLVLFAVDTVDLRFLDER